MLNTELFLPHQRLVVGKVNKIHINVDILVFSHASAEADVENSPPPRNGK